MEEEIEIISQTILEFQDSGRTSNDALARIIIGNLEKNGYKLKKLSQHDVIKNGVAVCDCHLSGKVQMCSLPNCHGGIPT
jgi:hypothetical protein